MKFADIFAGLGGFHVSLKRLGHQCVFACEIDAGLRKLYSKNFCIEAFGDIRKVPISRIPKHDILCAGFPCQPFSKAGSQRGTDCPEYGDLFGFVIQILRQRRPRYFILENVPNLAQHNSGATWKTMTRRLKLAGYSIDHARLSPHQFGIPQIRERMYVVGSRSGLGEFKWPEHSPDPQMSIMEALENNPSDARSITPQVIECLSAWQDFISEFPRGEELPSFPIWSMEFGATYPYESTTPHAVGARGLARYLGSHGRPLNELPLAKRIDALPSHARTRKCKFPDWKIDFIRKNRALYTANAEWIDKWIPRIACFPSSLQKLEWNCKGGERDIWKYVIQFRASGVRVKRPTSSPSLIAMTSTQVPIIAWQRRYMTPRECAALQCLGEITHLPAAPTPAFRALGNAVNADVVELIAKALFGARAPAQKVVARPRTGRLTRTFLQT